DAVGRDGTDDRGPAAGVLAPRARDAGPGSALGDRLAVDVDRPLRRALPREEGLDARAPRLAHRTPALRRAEELVDRARERGPAPRLHHDARLAFRTDDLRQRARPRRHDRHAARHRLAGRKAEAFVERRHDRDRRLRVVARDVLGVDAAGEAHDAVETVAADRLDARRALVRNADHAQLETRPARAQRLVRL